MTIQSKIQDLRKRHNLTQSQLAEISGVSLPSITRLEGEKSTIRLDILTRVLDALGYELQIVSKKNSTQDSDT